MRCSYCRYSQRGKKISFIGPEELGRRVQILMDRGAKNIRFVDPTFNANPAFRQILETLRSSNRNGRGAFFGEIQVIEEDFRSPQARSFLLPVLDQGSRSVA